MVLTAEFILGLIVAFIIGYLIAMGLERIFHLTLDESEWQNLKSYKQKNHD